MLKVEELVEKGLTTKNRVKKSKEIKVYVKERFGTQAYGECIRPNEKMHHAMVDVVSGSMDCDCTDFKTKKGSIVCADILALLSTVTSKDVNEMTNLLEEKETFISTGCESLDKLLGGGLPCRVITLAYSSWNVGKSMLGVQAATMAVKTTGKPALYVDTEDNWTLKSDRDRVLGFLQRRFEMETIPEVHFVFIPDIYDLMTYFGKELFLEASEKAHKITAKIVPTCVPKKSPAYIACQDHEYSMLILDSLSGPIKDEIPTPPSENFPSRAVVINGVLGRFRRCVVDLNIPGYITAHSSSAPAPFKQRGKQQTPGEAMVAKPYGPAPVGYHIKRILHIKGNPKTQPRTMYRLRGPGLIPMDLEIQLKWDYGFCELEDKQ